MGVVPLKSSIEMYCSHSQNIFYWLKHESGHKITEINLFEVFNSVPLLQNVDYFSNTFWVNRKMQYVMKQH